MTDKSSRPSEGLRPWQVKDRWVDGEFFRLVPSEKWEYFAQRIRPLAEEPSTLVWKALFAGVARPFHYKLARGWMGEVFKRVRSQPSDARAGESAEQALTRNLGWEASAIIYQVYSAREIYLGSWSDVMDCYRKGWLPLDTVVICCDASSRVALYWEGQGPYFAKRGDRSLANSH